MTTKKIQATEDGTPTGDIVFTFDDKSVEVFSLSKVPTALHNRLMLHGASQKIGDSYAAASGSDNPLAFAKQAVKETIAQLYAGDWRAVSGTGPRVNDLATALSRLTGKTVEDSVAFVETLDDDQKKAWKAKGKVKAMLATIAAERAAAKAAKLAAAAAAGDKATSDESNESLDFA